MLSNPVAIKVVALFLLAVLKLGAGLGPMLFADTLRGCGERRAKAATSLALCFGGGVLFASCMLHMVPKVRDTLALTEWKTSFPLAELVVCCGFFAVFLAEEFVGSLTRADTAGFRSAEAEMRISGRVGPVPGSDAPKTDPEGSAKSRHVLILSALSLHAVLEGLAMGLQSTVQAVWMLFAAIVIHAVIVLFSMGMKLVSDGLSDVQIVSYMAISALSSPLGGCIGLAATQNGGKAHVGFIVALQGLAAGAVLFITFFEILEKERRKGGFIRLFCIISGFAAMTGLQIIDDHDHSSEELVHEVVQ